MPIQTVRMILWETKSDDFFSVGKIEPETVTRQQAKAIARIENLELEGFRVVASPEIRTHKGSFIFFVLHRPLE